jgi:hypothetical protein
MTRRHDRSYDRGAGTDGAVGCRRLAGQHEVMEVDE